jgi:hypothetical protein
MPQTPTLAIEAVVGKTIASVIIRPGYVSIHFEVNSGLYIHEDGEVVFCPYQPDETLTTPLRYNLSTHS